MAYHLDRLCAQGVVVETRERLSGRCPHCGQRTCGPPAEPQWVDGRASEPREPLPPMLGQCPRRKIAAQAGGRVLDDVLRELVD
ncbi:hypothetical protein [Streptomyces cavernicola]|uniref:ArsR family transcriptional regulator n=1 Tax=Streptomyces cavernicola TaxID=3043613 RepID=A0ABT6SCM8_9ACTN|nr:hypothetical protein [Streptomyces sp. B-S-A6]MDI3405951.1 hypothetical protein [Streptomyces sp. B-S-A6]